MAYTAHTTEEAMREHFDPPDVLGEKIAQLAELVRQSKHMIAFTGAGISTSAGISDFRGPNGVWTRKAQGRPSPAGVMPVKALPTPTHMALVELQQQGALKYLVSQNCDGLHRRSGFPPHAISELHGNSNIEECEDCGQQYFRDFACHRANRGRDHATGRSCTRPACGGRLLEYTIDFGQHLPEVPLEKAFDHGGKADLCIALGSSLTVSPAADVPQMAAVARNRDLVIVNLQNTPLTSAATMQIYARTDDVMTMLMTELGYSIPKWVLCREIEVCCEPTGHEDRLRHSRVRAIDRDDPSLPVAVLRGVSVFRPDHDEIAVRGQTVEDYKMTSAHEKDLGEFEVDVSPGDMLHLTFFGHYCEPDTAIRLPVQLTTAPRDLPLRATFDLEYDVTTGNWTLVQLPSVGVGEGAEPPIAPKDERPNANAYGRSHAKYVAAHTKS